MYAAEHGHADIVQRLLASGADPDIQNNYGNTALICAAKKGNDNIVQQLLASAAKPNLRNNNDATALSIAEGRGFFEIVELLQIFSKKDDTLFHSSQDAAEADEKQEP